MTRRTREKAPKPSKVAGAFQNQQTEFTHSARFTGTDNPRHLRAITVLLRRPVPREALDSIAGASNSPELVAELRRRGLEIPCERVKFTDRDGKPCRPGVYSLTLTDRRMVYAWLAKRGKEAAHAGAKHTNKAQR
ncbi:MAG: hypothetical protein Q8K50_16360 [Hydrogenophaga sp.]|nr:hypothetical protein [Hydrogenophaga sp.]